MLDSFGGLDVSDPVSSLVERQGNLAIVVRKAVRSLERPFEDVVDFFQRLAGMNRRRFETALSVTRFPAVGSRFRAPARSAAKFWRLVEGSDPLQPTLELTFDMFTPIPAHPLTLLAD